MSRDRRAASRKQRRSDVSRSSREPLIRHDGDRLDLDLGAFLDEACDLHRSHRGEVPSDHFAIDGADFLEDGEAVIN